MLTLVQPSDPILRRQAARIQQVTPAIERLARQMFETMYAGDGVGLAAPQVGSSIRLIVLDGRALDPALKPVALANPEIVWRSRQTNIRPEGCLSLPGIEAEVRRPAAVRMRAEQLGAGPVTLEAVGWQARILQHEIDHVNGILFIDHVPAAKRWWLKRRVKNQAAMVAL